MTTDKRFALKHFTKIDKSEIVKLQSNVYILIFFTFIIHLHQLQLKISIGKSNVGKKTYIKVEDTVLIFKKFNETMISLVGEEIP